MPAAVVTAGPVAGATATTAGIPTVMGSSRAAETREAIAGQSAAIIAHQVATAVRLGAARRTIVRRGIAPRVAMAGRQPVITVRRAATAVHHQTAVIARHKVAVIARRRAGVIARRRAGAIVRRRAVGIVCHQAAGTIVAIRRRIAIAPVRGTRATARRKIARAVPGAAAVRARTTRAPGPRKRASGSTGSGNRTWRKIRTA